MRSSSSNASTVPFSHPFAGSGCSLILAALLASAMPPAFAQVRVQEIRLISDANLKWSPSTDLWPVSSELERATFPFASFSGDGVARADVLRGNRSALDPIYASALQQGTSNAVAAQLTYTSDSQVSARAVTGWFVEIVNTGTEAVPVDFSFYISGGGLRLWCAACVTGGLTASATASISATHTLMASQSPSFKWEYTARLQGTPWLSGARVTLVDGILAGSEDDLGIGFPSASIVDTPSSTRLAYEDRDHVVAISEFNATARLFDLQPGETGRIDYGLIAEVEGIGGAYGTAWLTDPFSLGGDPSLPSARFAINGIPIETLVPIAAVVPEPRAWLLFALGLAVIAMRRSGFARRRAG